MYLALYKGPSTGFTRQIGHLAVCLWTRSDYSHCELVFGDISVDGVGLCASASLRDGGVRFKHLDLYSGRWDLINLSAHGFDDDDEKFARAWFEAHEGAKYDYFGLAFFLTSLRTQQRQRWFCSEAVGAALKLPKPYKLSPESLNKLYR